MPPTVFAMKLQQPGGQGALTSTEVPMPEPGPEEALVRVAACGFCHHDLLVMKGLLRRGVKPGLIPGHEFSGIVTKVGGNVATLKPGDRVVSLLVSACGHCDRCLQGREHRCRNGQGIGHGRDGGFAEYVLIDQRQAHIVPDGLDPETASMTEPAACVISCLNMLGDIEEGCDALVVGGGLLGLFTVGMLRLRGAGRIILSEPNPKRLAMGRQFGADVLNDPTKDDLGELVNDLTGGWGVKIGAEAVGVPQLVANVSKMVRPRGNLVLVGVSPVGSPLPIDLYDIHYKEITISGAYGAGDAFAEALEALLRLKLEGVVSGRFPLEAIQEAFAASAGGEGVKYMIAPND